MDISSFVLGLKMGENGGGGGGDITVEQLNVSSNNTYTAPSGKAYSPVVVNVPNSYTQSDEGKVVSNGALVSQTSDTVTENDTYDTTLINSLTVNVAGGGGGGSNIRTGSFTPSTAGVAESVDTGYTGNGYPIGIMIIVDGGTNNATYTAAAGSNLVGIWTAAKNLYGTAPSYSGAEGSDDTSVLAYRKSGSTIQRDAYAAKSFHSNAPTSYVQNCIRMSNKSTLRYLSDTTASGGNNGVLLTGTKYNYWVIYSE